MQLNFYLAICVVLGELIWVSWKTVWAMKGVWGFYVKNKLSLLEVHGRPAGRVYLWFIWATMVGLIFISGKRKILDCGRMGEVVYN